MVNYKRLIYLIIILSPAFTSCTPTELGEALQVTYTSNLPAGYEAVNGTPIPPGADDDGLTRIAREAQDAQGTVDARATGTAVQIGVTQTHVAGQTATATHEVKQTADAGTAVFVALDVTGTAQALAMEADAATAEAAKDQRIEEENRIREQELQQTIDLEQQALLLENEAKAREMLFWETARNVGLVVLTVLVVVLGLAVFVLGTAYGWVRVMGARTVQYAQVGNFGRLPVINDGAKTTLMSMAEYVRLSNLSSQPQPPESQGVDTRKLTGSWDAFCKWSDPDLILVGVDFEKRAPVTISLPRNPHLLIVGSSGSGKSGTGLVSFILECLAKGKHVVIINGKGADFKPFVGHRNVTMFPLVSEEELLESLSAFITAAVSEIDRRNLILNQHGVNNWCELPQGTDASGEMIIVVDELLDVVKAGDRKLTKAQRNIKQAKRALKQAKGREEKQIAEGNVAAAEAELAKTEEMIEDLWDHMGTLASKARKFGIFLCLSLTDPTGDVLGKKVMPVRREMTVLGYRMKAPAASRTILGVGKAEGFPNGSAGNVPVGQFIYNIDGEYGQASGFYGAPEQIVQHMDTHPAPPNPLPGVLLDVAPVVQAPVNSMPLEPVRMITQAESDGRKLNDVITQVTSLRDVARFITGQQYNDKQLNPSGQSIDRGKAALRWRVNQMNCPQSRRLLTRSSK